MGKGKKKGGGGHKCKSMSKKTFLAVLAMKLNDRSIGETVTINFH